MTGTPLSVDFPAYEGRTVQQRHANYCHDHGHVKHTVNGVTSPFCPRCGEERKANA